MATAKDIRRETFFSLRSFRWTPFSFSTQPDTGIFKRRNAAVTALLPANTHNSSQISNYLYLFGGHNGNSASYDFYCFDPFFHKWIALPVNSNVDFNAHVNPFSVAVSVNPSEGPGGRYRHTMVGTASHIYIFGGRSNSGRLLNDLWAYDISTQNWKLCITKNDPPSPRESHVSALLSDRYMLVIGGNTRRVPPQSETRAGKILSPSRVVEDRIYMLDLSTLQWYSAPHRVLGALEGASAVTVGRTVYVFGGWDHATGVPTNHVWALRWNVTRERGEQFKCSLVRTHGAVPSPREGHVAVAVGDTYMIVFGGWDRVRGIALSTVAILDIQKKSWNTLQPLGPGPSARTGHAAAAVDMSTVLVIGGEDASSVGGIGIKPNILPKVLSDGHWLISKKLVQEWLEGMSTRPQLVCLQCGKCVDLVNDTQTVAFLSRDIAAHKACISEFLTECDTRGIDAWKALMACPQLAKFEPEVECLKVMVNSHWHPIGRCLDTFSQQLSEKFPQPADNATYDALKNEVKAFIDYIQNTVRSQMAVLSCPHGQEQLNKVVKGALFTKIYAVIMESYVHKFCATDEAFRRQQIAVKNVSLKSLELDERLLGVLERDPRFFPGLQTCSALLSLLPTLHSPYAKFDLLLLAWYKLQQLTAVSAPLVPTPDDMLCLTTYLLINVHVPLHAEMQFLLDWSDPWLSIVEPGYCLAQLQAAMANIEAISSKVAGNKTHPACTEK